MGKSKLRGINRRDIKTIGNIIVFELNYRGMKTIDKTRDIKSKTERVLTLL